MIELRLTLAVIVACGVIGGLLPPVPAQANFTGLPVGFTDQPVVSEIGVPTGIGWLPDGTLLIATLAGILYRSSDAEPAQIVLDLSEDVCDFNEMGLLGLAVDPDFRAGNRFIYLYYTERRGADCGGEANLASRANRVSRFSVDAGGDIDVGSELVLVDNISARGTAHNAGDLQFDNNGLLYVSVGDAGADLETGQLNQNNTNARRLDILNGKILRITRDGAIPPGNPFQGNGTVRCSATGEDGQATPPAEQLGSQVICQEIFSTGLRNPFRIAFDPNDTEGAQRFFINDVGGVAWEEIDDGAPEADYGWNVREGPCPVDVTDDNCTPDRQFVEPIFAYRRDGRPAAFAGCGAITGGAFVPDSANWPAEFDSVYLFADGACAKLFVLRNEAPGAALEVFATGFTSADGAIHLAFGPDNALYYSTFAVGGQVRKIVFEGLPPPPSPTPPPSDGLGRLNWPITK